MDVKKYARVSTRPDFGSFLGVFLALGCMGAGLLLEGGKLSDIGQAAAALVVLGGTLGAVLIATPLPIVARAWGRVGSVFFYTRQPFPATLNQLLRLADRARRFGLASLEAEAATIEDPFFQKAVSLAADGMVLNDLRDMLEIDLRAEEERDESAVCVFERAAGYAPTVGIVGAVLGLIQVMKHLENLDDVGRGIAVAFVATIYGVASANILFLPAASKLRAADQELSRYREMIIEGVISVAEGVNPKLLSLKLESYLETRPSKTTRPVTVETRKPVRPSVGEAVAL